MKTVISVGTAKEAALYFDKVFPHGLAETAANSVKYEGRKELYDLPISVRSQEFKDVLSSLLPGDSNSFDRFFNYFAVTYFEHLVEISVVAETMTQEQVEGLVTTIKVLNLRLSLGWKLPHVLRRPEKYLPKLRKIASKLLRDGGLSNSPLWIDEIAVQNSIRPKGHEPSATEQFAISLQNLKLVDLSKVSWPTIIEFRKDAESRAALRDLRLFFADNFVGKDSEYVSDKLQQQMDRYERTTKLWGMETANKALTVAISDIPTLVASAGVLALAATSMTLPLAAAAAAVVPVGKGALAFWKINIDSQRERLDRPVRYLTQLKSIKADVKEI
jgi:hypothetical protein